MSAPVLIVQTKNKHSFHKLSREVIFEFWKECFGLLSVSGEALSAERDFDNILECFSSPFPSPDQGLCPSTIRNAQV